MDYWLPMGDGRWQTLMPGNQRPERSGSDKGKDKDKDKDEEGTR